MRCTYGFSIKLPASFDGALDVVTRELKRQGFGIASDIDVQAIFKKKLAIDEGRYRILGAFNAWVAHQALRADPNIGLLLPFNVVVRDDRTGVVTIAFTAPEALLGLVYRTDMIELGKEVRNRLENVRDAVKSELTDAVARSTWVV